MPDEPTLPPNKKVDEVVTEGYLRHKLMIMLGIMRIILLLYQI